MNHRRTGFNGHFLKSRLTSEEEIQSGSMNRKYREGAAPIARTRSSVPLLIGNQLVHLSVLTKDN
jgi:hypothetical protein